MAEDVDEDVAVMEEHRKPSMESIYPTPTAHSRSKSGPLWVVGVTWFDNFVGRKLEMTIVVEMWLLP
jgi:hypothetical protein